MAYDYNWSSPGPIGPNDWATQVAQSAVQQVGEEYAERVWIGAPQYGRNWPLQAGTGWSVNAECPAGWKPKETFESGIRKTVNWYLENKTWVEGVTTGEYRQWMSDNYGKRGAS